MGYRQEMQLVNGQCDQLDAHPDTVPILYEASLLCIVAKSPCCLQLEVEIPEAHRELWFATQVRNYFK